MLSYADIILHCTRKPKKVDKRKEEGSSEESGSRRRFRLSEEKKEETRQRKIKQAEREIEKEWEKKKDAAFTSHKKNDKHEVSKNGRELASKKSWKKEEKEGENKKKVRALVFYNSDSGIANVFMKLCLLALYNIWGLVLLFSLRTQILLHHNQMTT